MFLFTLLSTPMHELLNLLKSFKIKTYCSKFGKVHHYNSIPLSLIHSSMLFLPQQSLWSSLISLFCQPAVNSIGGGDTVS